MRSTACRWTALALAGATIALGLTPGAPAQAEQAARWLSPLTKGKVTAELVAASGTSILVFLDDRYRLSTDFGATWTELADGLNIFAADSPDFVQDGWAAFDSLHAVNLVDLTSGALHAVDLTGLGLGNAESQLPVADTTDRNTLLWDGETLKIAAIWSDFRIGVPADVVTDPLMDPPTATSDSTDDWSVDHFFAYHVTSYQNSRSTGLATDVDPVNLDGTAGYAAFRTSGELLRLEALDATHLEYFSRSGTAVNRCVRDLVESESSCAYLRKVSKTAWPVTIDKQGDVVLLEAGSTWYSCTLSRSACRLGKITAPKGRHLDAFVNPVGDPAQPLLSVSGAGAGAVYSLSSSRALVKRFSQLEAPLRVDDLSIGGDRLVGTDGRDSSGLWQRSLTDGIGTEVSLGRRVDTVTASAGRIAAFNGSGLDFYDGRSVTSTGGRIHELLGMSGPYPIVNRSSDWFTQEPWAGVPLGRYTSLGDSVARANFGTRVLGGTDCLYSSLCMLPEGEATTLVVSDLLDQAYRREIPLPAGLDPQYTHVLQGFLYGDRVAVTFLTFSFTETSFATSLTSGIYDYAGTDGEWVGLSAGTQIWGLGDGFVVRQTASGYSAWDFVNDVSYPLQGTDDTTDSFAVGADRVGYANRDELIVQKVPGSGGSVPRVLGVVADPSCNAWNCTWTPQIDLTRAVDAGSLVIRNSANEEVATLDTPAAADGSIRGVTWNGKLDAGGFAQPGTYSWTLAAPASDGSGDAVGVDGASVPGGSIAVTRTFLGKAKFSRVAISDTTPTVDQTVKAVVGVFPADADLSYAWYAGSKLAASGAGEAFASYRVQPGDLGRKLKLVVTAEREGTTTASKASATTKAVARARFSATARPTLTVDSGEVRATVAGWSPTATFSYQWYRLVPGKKAVKAGPHDPVYALTSADNGAQLRLVVTGSRPGYYPVTTSATTGTLTVTP